MSRSGASAPAAPAARGDEPGASVVLACVVLALVLSVVWAWWGLEDGAFFEPVAYPGAILLLLTLATLLLSAPLRLATRGPHVVALAALAGLLAWTLLSLLWTPSRDVAIEDAGKLLIYLASFLAGLMLANLLGRRVIWAVLPYCVAGAVVAGITVITLLGVDASLDVLDESGTLDYPLGYRNANAAFFAGVALTALGVGARRGAPLPGALAAGLAALCLGLAVLSQSRGSVPAFAIGLLVLFAFSAERLRLMALVACVAAPLAIAFPTLLEPFSVAEDGVGAGAELRDATQVSIAAAAAAAIAALVALAALDHAAARVQPSLRARRSIAGGITALLVAGAVAFVVAVGSPVSWISDQVPASFSETRDSGDSRFLYTGGRNRTDFWRVSIDAAAGSPLAGEGSGAFRQVYALERRSRELPLDAHSLPLETLAELGVIGLALLLLPVVAGFVAIRRSARLGPQAAAIAAAAFGTGAYYLAHTSIDWLWSFPGLIAPAIALIGIASAPAARSPSVVSRAVTRSAAAALALAAVAIAPLFISARLVAAGEARAFIDPSGARDQLERAAELNPFADRPYLLIAQIAAREGETDAALAALEKGRDREPGEWTNYALAAQILVTEDPRRAARELRLALEINPGEDSLDELERRLRRSSSSGVGGGRPPPN